MCFPSPKRISHCLLLLLLCGLTVSGGRAAEPADESPPPVANYEALANLLEDEQSRARLIEELRRLSAQQPPPAAVEEVATEDAGAAGGGFAARLAATSKSAAQQLVTEFTASVEAIASLARGELQMSPAELTATSARLGILILVTVGVFLLLRGIARVAVSAIDTRTARKSRGSRLLRRGMGAIAAVAVDALVVALAWVGGYLVALFAFGDAGTMDDLEPLFLNAFLAVELFKVLLRALFAVRDDGLRLLPLPAEEAAYWYAWLARLSGFVGYGILFLVPLAGQVVSPEVGRLAAVLVMLSAFVYALTILMQNRERVTRGIQARAQGSELAYNRVLLSMLARTWYWLTIGYFALLALVTLLRPEDALPYVLWATLQSLAVIGGGVFVSVVLSEIIGRRLQLSDETRQRFPTLEPRLNSYIPTALKVMRAFIQVAVALLVLDAWGVFNLAEWLESETGAATLGKIVTVALIVVAAAAIWTLLASWIEHRLGEEAGKAVSPRTRTLLAIFRSAIAVVLAVMTLMVVLAEIGINIGPLIAGAGVVGLAVGFGAQKLVQDIITGVFIQLENAINVGEFVTAGGTSGTVEKLTIRSLGMRDLAGTYHIVPFSSVDKVSNFMRGYGYHLAEYGVAYREDIDEVMQCLREAFEELKQDPEQRDNILDELEIPGVTSFGDSSVNIRVRIKAAPGAQWSVGRAYNRLVKRHFDAAGIEIPFPHTTLYFGQDKDGSAPPANVVVQGESPERLDGGANDPDYHHASPDPEGRER